MTARSTDLVLVPGLVCTEDLFAEQIASLARNLPGYVEYQKKVRYRLIPLIC
jgi:hypothetical protein